MGETHGAETQVAGVPQEGGPQGASGSWLRCPGPAGPGGGKGGDVASADEKPEQLGRQTPERRAEGVRVRGGFGASPPAGQLAQALVSTQSSDQRGRPSAWGDRREVADVEVLQADLPEPRSLAGGSPDETHTWPSAAAAAAEQGWTQWILVLENLLNATWSGVGLR